MRNRVQTIRDSGGQEGNGEQQQWNQFAAEQQLKARENARGAVGSGGSAIVPRPGSGSTRQLKTRYDSQRLPGDPSNSSFQESQTLDPSHPSFERRENSVYQATSSSKIYPADFPEVREYMRWRVQRNKKRLRKLTSAASCIQKGFRSYMTDTHSAHETGACRIVCPA